jgi:hypothetical protein
MALAQYISNASIVYSYWLGKLMELYRSLSDLVRKPLSTAIE